MPTINADTPQELLDALIIWANERHNSTLRHFTTPNQSEQNRTNWAVRAGTVKGLRDYLATITISPRTSVINLPQAKEAQLETPTERNN